MNTFSNLSSRQMYKIEFILLSNRKMVTLNDLFLVQQEHAANVFV